MSSIGNRIREARCKAGFRFAAEAADSMGIPQPTYRAHENGSRIPRHDELDQYARKYKVSAEWLMTGKKHGISESSIEKAISYIFKSIPAEDLVEMDPEVVAEMTMTIGKAVEGGTSKDEIVTNVVTLFAEKSRQTS